MKQETAVPVRPHHGLCLNFFIGKGYSANFVENMVEIRKKLDAEPDTEILLTGGPDIFCTPCPHRISGSCAADGKAASYDKKCSRLCGFSVGQRIKWKNFKEKIGEKILTQPGAFTEMCSDCMWFSICQQLYVEKLLKGWKT